MNYRRTLIRAVTFLGGLYFFLEFILPGEFLGIKTATYDQDISNGLITVSAMALGLGVFNILLVHGSKIIFRRGGYPYSIALLLGLALMLGATIIDWRSSAQTAADVGRYFTLRDFAERIDQDAKAQTPGVLPVWERNAKLQAAAWPLLEEASRGVQKFALPSDAQDSDLALAGSLKTDLGSLVESARAAVEAIPTGSEIETGGVIGTGSVTELSLRTAEAGRAIGAVGSSRLALLNIGSKYTTAKRVYDFLYTGLFVSLGAAMFSLLGFYIASAAYRAFRIRSGESALMMTAAFLVMLGQIPFGLWIWSELPEVRLWLLSVPSAAAFRAIKIGAGVAGLVMAYRMWFSIESEEFTQRDRT